MSLFYFIFLFPLLLTRHTQNKLVVLIFGVSFLSCLLTNMLPGTRDDYITDALMKTKDEYNSLYRQVDCTFANIQNI